MRKGAEVAQPHGESEALYRELKERYGLPSRLALDAIRQAGSSGCRRSRRELEKG